MAPSGTKVIVYETPTQRSTWAPHGLNGFYVGPALEHYQWYGCKTICASAGYQVGVSGRGPFSNLWVEPVPMAFLPRRTWHKVKSRIRPPIAAKQQGSRRWTHCTFAIKTRSWMEQCGMFPLVRGWNFFSFWAPLPFCLRLYWPFPRPCR